MVVQRSDNRAQCRRYLKPHFGCLCCNRRRPWASARTRYLWRCLRCSRCNSRRCPLPGPLPGLPASSAEASRAHWSASRRRPVLPDNGWLALEPGELGVPDDRRAPGRPGATMSSGSAAGRHHGGGCRACHRAGTEAPGQRLGIVPRRDHRRRPGRPQAWPSAGAPCWIRARRTAMTSAITSSGSLRR